uniref:Lethal(3)malignant brain tumor-like protein 4 n=1 Tax=Phallusia mammillata TaxID=59560 RepID=A0A6F9DGU4_9ASCI|nr:lethal(3)malignant brain tumor-like protein 4 [Phallusia mammillata]
MWQLANGVTTMFYTFEMKNRNMLSRQPTNRSSFQGTRWIEVLGSHGNASALSSDTNATRRSQLEKKHFKETNLSTEREGMDVASSDLGLVWKGEVGTLPGSDLQFRINEFGDLDVLSDDESSRRKFDVTFVQATSKCCHIAAKSKSALTDGATIATQQPDSSRSNLSTCVPCSGEGIIANFQGRFCSHTPNAKNVCDKNKPRETPSRLSTERVPTYQFGLVVPPPSENTLLFKSNQNNPVCLDLETSHLKKSVVQKPTTQRKDSNPAKSNLQTSTIPEQPNPKFSWKAYMELNKAVPVPEQTFAAIHGLSPFPKQPNPFQVGCFLEAVDPDHRSEICLMKVAQVQGYRLRLHFVGDYSCYDIWAPADWPLIFPCGFCKSTGRKLNIANRLPDEVRDVDLPSLSSGQSDLLTNDPYKNSTVFKIGDKLEAVDRKNSDLICVATVVDIIGEYLLIHFDGWHNEYDYWARFNSPSIHPIGWCKSNNYILSLPPKYKGIFSWQQYIKLSKSQAASPKCFSTYDHRKDIKIGMKLEVVDHRNQLVVRVASIVDVDEFRVKVHYDGWGSECDVWMDIDSHDLHPPTWCLKTGHLLQPPVDLKNGVSESGCKTPGCKGLGHARRTVENVYRKKHEDSTDCPYSASNVHKLRDRLSVDAMQNRSLPIKMSSNAGNRVDINPDKVSAASQSTWTSPGKGRKRKKQRKQIVVNKRTKSLESDGRPSAIDHLRDFNVDLSDKLPTSQCWDKVVLALPGIQDVRADDVIKWNVSCAARFVSELTGRNECADALTREEIDGEALMLLTQEDITKRLNIKLGPALKIFNAALMLKSMEEQ